MGVGVSTFGKRRDKSVQDERADPRKLDLQPLAKVATLGALLVFGASQLLAPDDTAPVAYEAGSLVATGRLESVLYDPSLGGREEGPNAGKMFVDKAGHQCRRFSEGPVSGFACKRNGDWRIVEMTQR